MKLLKAECSNQEIEQKWNQRTGSLTLDDLQKSLPKVSVNIMVKNEERCIERCLKSIIDFADEIIIVDTGSTDQTLDIIHSFNDPAMHVFQKEWNHDFAEIRNFMVAKSSCRWILQLDADEELCDDFYDIKTLLAMCENDKDNPFYFINPRIQNSNGLIFSLTRRLFPNYSENRYVGIIHEELRVNSHTEANIVDLLIDGTILHDGYTEDVIQEKNKHVRNVKALEKMVQSEPQNPRWSYFLARDVRNGISQLKDYTIEDVKSLLQKTTEMTTYYPQMWEFIEGAYVLLEEILLGEEKWDSLLSWNRELKERFPKNADSYYFELMINQRNTYRTKAQFLQELFQQLKEKNATISRIDLNLTHVLSSLAASHYQNGDMRHAAFFLEELPPEIVQSFLKSQENQLNQLKQLLDSN